VAEFGWGTLAEVAAESKAKHLREVGASALRDPYSGSVHLRFFPDTTLCCSERGIRALHKARGQRAARARTRAAARLVVSRAFAFFVLTLRACVAMRVRPPPPRAAPHASLAAALACWPQWKKDNPLRAVLGLDFGIIASEEPGEQRLFTLVFNVSKGARARAGAGMWTPLVAFTAFPNAECIKALLRAVEGAEAYYCGNVAHLPFAIMDGALELVKAVSEACNGCSVGETLRRTRKGIERGEVPALKLTCIERDKFHNCAATGRWTDTRMTVPSAGPGRAFFKRFQFRNILTIWDAGRPAARPGNLKGKPLTAAEYKEALLQMDAHQQLVLHITTVATLPLTSDELEFHAAAALLPVTSVDALTQDDANAAAVACSNFDALPPSEFEALSQKDAEPPPSVPPGVEGDFYERLFRLNFAGHRQVRIYLLKKRAPDGMLRWLIKVGVDKDVPPEQLHVGGIDVSFVVETGADVLARLDAGEDVALPNPFKNESLYTYNRKYKFPLWCAALRSLRRCVCARDSSRLLCRLPCSFLIPGRPEDLSHSNIGEGRMVTLKNQVGLQGRPVVECVLKLTGNKAAPDEAGKQGFMEIDTKARATAAAWRRELR